MDEELSNGSMHDQSDGSMEELSETSSLLSLSLHFSMKNQIQTLAVRMSWEQLSHTCMSLKSLTMKA